MLSRKNVTVHLGSLCLLFIGFVLARYVFLEIHGMYQWPRLLFAVGLAAMAISFFLKAEKFPIFTALAYTVGFFAGVIFQTDSVDTGGARTNNLWIIWTAVFICFPAVMTFIARRLSPMKGEKTNTD